MAPRSPTRVGTIKGKLRKTLYRKGKAINSASEIASGKVDSAYSNKLKYETALVLLETERLKVLGQIMEQQNLIKAAEAQRILESVESNPVLTPEAKRVRGVVNDTVDIMKEIKEKDALIADLTKKANANPNSWQSKLLDFIKAFLLVISGPILTGVGVYLIFTKLQEQLTGCYQYQTINGQVRKTKVNCKEFDENGDHDNQPGTCHCLLKGAKTCTGGDICLCATPQCGGEREVKYIWEKPTILDIFSKIVDVGTRAIGDGFSNIFSPISFGNIFKYLLLGVGGIIVIFIVFKIFEHYMDKSMDSKFMFDELMFNKRLKFKNRFKLI